MADLDELSETGTLKSKTSQRSLKTPSLSETGTLKSKASQRSLKTPSKLQKKPTSQKPNKLVVKKPTSKAQETKKPVVTGPTNSTQTKALENLNDHVGFTKMLMEQLNDSLTPGEPSRINDPKKIMDLSKYYHSSKTKPKATTGKTSRAKGGKESTSSQDLRPVPSEELTSMKHDLLCNYRGKTIPIQRDPIRPQAIPKLQSRKKTSSTISKKPSKVGSSAGISNSTPPSTFPSNTNLPKTMTSASTKDECFEKLMRNPHTVEWIAVKKTQLDDFLEPDEFKKLEEKFQDLTFEEFYATVDEVPTPDDKLKPIGGRWRF